MFTSFYKLEEQPFGVNPDPRYLYLSETHRQVFSSLLYRIQANCGFLAMIAPPGMGKTTLLFHLLSRLQPSAQTAFVFQTQCSSNEFMRHLLSEFAGSTETADPVRMFHELKTILLTEANAGRRCIALIDEAQNLQPEVLETIRLLSDFETPRRKLLQIILSGQPELEEKLASPALCQLRQRLSSIARLQKFGMEDTVRYIAHRLRTAGRAGEVTALFEVPALARIAMVSDGIPRVINNVCFNALALGFARGVSSIDLAIVDEVAQDLGMASHSGVEPVPASDLDAVSLASKKALAEDGGIEVTSSLLTEFGTSTRRSTEEVFVSAWTGIGMEQPIQQTEPGAPTVRDSVSEIAGSGMSVQEEPEPPTPVRIPGSSNQTMASLPGRPRAALRKFGVSRLSLRDQQLKGEFASTAAVGAEGSTNLEPYSQNRKGQSDLSRRQVRPSSLDTIRCRMRSAKRTLWPENSPSRRRALRVGAAAAVLLVAGGVYQYVGHQTVAGSVEVMNSPERLASAPSPEPEMVLPVPLPKPHSVAASDTIEPHSTSRPASAAQSSSAKPAVVSTPDVEPIEKPQVKGKLSLPKAIDTPPPTNASAPLPAFWPATLSPAVAGSTSPHKQVVPSPKQVVVPARAIEHPQPVYPAFAQAQSLRGDVVLLLSITKTGTVQKATVVSGNPVLASFATSALLRWKYAPSLVDGHPVDSQAQVVIHYAPNN